MEEKTSEQIAQEIRDLETKNASEQGGDQEQVDDVDTHAQDQGQDKKTDDKKVEKQEDNEEDEEVEIEDVFEEVKEKKEKEAKKSTEDQDSDEDDLSEEDQKKIDERAQAKIDEYRAEVEAKESRDKNWNKYVEENPHLEKYSENIRPYMHKVYNDLVNKGIGGVKVVESKAFDVITAMILGKGMYKIGASMEKAARDKANANTQNSNGRRTDSTKRTGGIPDVTNMSPEEFRALEIKVENGEFAPIS